MPPAPWSRTRLGSASPPRPHPGRSRDGRPQADSLGLNGPSGGNIAAMGIREILAVVSSFVRET